MARPHGTSHGIQLKKKYGQHFLRDASVVQAMLDRVDITDASVFEIGCGDGFLTHALQQTKLKTLWVFEIDPEWAEHVQTTFPDGRMTMFTENILDIDFAPFKPLAPWTLLANLPYQITFPILKKLVQNRDLLSEGVIMIQEEVAQKIVAKPGDSTNQSLYFGYYFEWELLKKVPPGAFYPPPAVYSRLLYFKPKKDLKPIPDEAAFWKFVKICFMQRRRTLKNNLATTHYDLSRLPEALAKARAQELSLEQFLELWDILRAAK